MVYRTLNEMGYQFRIRVYNIKEMECNGNIEKNFNSTDVSTLSDQYVIKDNYVDFKLNTSSSVLAINMYEGDKIMLSMDPDIYKFRLFKQESNPIWSVSYGPVIDRKEDKVFFCISLTHYQIEDK